MNFANRNYNEKRDFLRMQVDAPVSLYILGRDDAITGVCKDLSGGGLLVELREEIDLGTTLSVVISSTHGHSPILEAQARITRLKETADQRFIAGLEIVEVVDNNSV